LEQNIPALAPFVPRFNVSEINGRPIPFEFPAPPHITSGVEPASRNVGTRAANSPRVGQRRFKAGMREGKMEEPPPRRLYSSNLTDPNAAAIQHKQSFVPSFARVRHNRFLRVALSSFLPLLLAAILPILMPVLASADELYQMHWSGTVYTNSPDGKIVARHFSELDFLRKVASDNGITDVRALRFVYRPLKHDTAAVWAANGGFVADVIQLGLIESQYGYTEISNGAGSFTARQAFLFDEAHPNAIGSSFGLERAKRNSNGDLISYNFHGSFQYAYPEQQAVYSGTFSTGKRIRDTSAP
jgi:hypothetical protein